MGVRGNLAEVAPAEVFQLMGRRHRSGLLKAQHGTLKLVMNFQDALVVGVEATNRPVKDRLGERLVRADLLRRRSLAPALEMARKGHRPLGAVLQSKTGLSTERLLTVLRLQALETLYDFLRWAHGSYELIPDEAVLTREMPIIRNPNQPPPQEELVLDLKWEAVLMEGLRQINEWPEINNVVPGPGTMFEPGQPLPAQVAPQLSEDEELARAFLGGDGEAPVQESLGPVEHAVHALVTPGVTAQEVADHSLVGEFEAFSALARLVRLGYLEVQSEDVVF